MATTIRSWRPAAGLIQTTSRRTIPIISQSIPRIQRSTPSTPRPISTTTSTPIGPPLNIPKWVSENAHMLKPPINNYCVYNDSVTVMIVGGPNQRTDYHINETPEWFYQYKGSMLLKIVDETQPPGAQFRDIHIHEGDMFLLPPNTPHNPVRFKDTVGVVLEQKRPDRSLDRLRWYCQACGDKVYEDAFHCTDLGSQIKDAVNAFKADVGKRTCKNCGTVCDTAPKPKD
ncbi:hypothetical protein COCC4DRAFT_53245 [Bipolaris maydis ATCC 48331]|uniref:3-hydroxyanthranilate 3,4-dioxygenase n=2 Tax=Cochliobolus heterostrophus TaxID=5016 RepID=M2TA84_COCH5|nr:uncharacterized protein COCC4DRAFT_53245 [Bipolaris maydis ATCC 48331]EMD94465.1 hypothetical protein COCHEDRAFT_1192538 [Bipolaris maydis C5]KAJ5026394.1 3-hydroxyanthranilic acid dioxygenase-domain-containing protein [Bipolaris maydis]ENI01193.1 hypothetical protein COCC4DRAFT_53245 [Bipolaris maydis ATCC 48331]KAJ5059885.1 3-hydroxyanthranilate 3,4-dioxygenase [Bipolaris maydis]KAJ6197148.1 3-hydroxyanthranilate 3,4-dioxygenase [Bipolaris maydis]